jgi:glycosyltransferase involved in cell wall biosynthesis
MTNSNRLIFFGELPPQTVHGVSISSEINLKMLEEKYDVTKVIEEYSLKNHSSSYLLKTFLFINSILKFLKKNCLNKFDFFYGIIYLSSLGILKNLILVTIYKLTNPKGKVVLHFHRSDYRVFIKNNFNNLIFNFLDLFIHRYILLSDSQINDFTKNKNKFFILYNTIQNEFSFPIKSRNTDSNCLKVIYLGNFIKEKGIIELINAVIIFNNENNSRIILNLYGVFTSVNLRNNIFKLINGLDYIKINGPIYNKNKFLKVYESDLLVLPSYNEGLPLVLLESLSVGTPVIISRVGYINDVLGDDYPLYCDAKSISSILKKFNEYIEFENKHNLNKLILENYNKYSQENHRIKLLNIFNFEN